VGGGEGESIGEGNGRMTNRLSRGACPVGRLITPRKRKLQGQEERKKRCESETVTHLEVGNDDGDKKAISLYRGVEIKA
jgi:hypothetical protein